ncbi:DNA repair ATPase [Arenicella sp. 4NH20-0111]|uniref:DNA repair ATPase n=1 Tax=Arenicella sp. 4NH20-0111 TaxID=3127648 RepID=UPI003103AC97
MASSDNQILDNAVAEAGAYEVIRTRLDEQGKQLKKHAQDLNKARLAEFGGVQMEAIGRTRVRTENNCIARDIVQVGDALLFGYNVFIGLKKETRIDDVFALLELDQDSEDLTLKAIDLKSSFLSDSSFKSDFEELYRYYKAARLVKLTTKDGKLLAGFQVGERASDLRVFRWTISPDGTDVSYIDNRGERDIQLPQQYDFEWIDSTRDDFVHGKHPHVNIADRIFVETIGGDLTVKIEDNTEDGLGIYSEPVEEKNQSLDDADVSYAMVGDLILLAIRPYKENDTRYLVFNTLTEDVHRIDALGQSCVQLPEDHGIIFPGGVYLQTGESKSFPDEVKGLQFKRTIRSPNGEDVLYIFYEPIEGKFALFSYNLITKSLQNPIYSNGYALRGDGKLVIFSAEHEPTRVHPMQVWQTSYISAEFASQQPESSTELGKIGNSELVRGVSDLYSIYAQIENKEVSMRHYEELNRAAKRVFDSHYWLENPNNKTIASTLHDIASTSELVIDEFEKVQSIQQQSSQALADAKKEQQALISRITTTTWETAEQFVSTISELRKQRGHLATIKSYRYIDVHELESLSKELIDNEDVLGQQTVIFLSNEASLESYHSRTLEFTESIDIAQSNADIKPVLDRISDTTAQLDLLSELITTLDIEDTTVRTRIVDTISEVYAKLNQTKAKGAQKQKGLGSEEAIAQFSAQFKLFSQSITNALSAANTPEKCDDQLAKLLVQLEDLESQFSEFDQFLSDIMEKREEIYDSFEAHKQSLIEAQQRRAQTLSDSASRILKSIEKRSLKLSSNDELNTYFASDALVMKISDLVGQLRDLNSEVAADDIDSRFKALKEQAIRSLRDKSDIYEDGGKVIKLGTKHKFSVNQQDLDLTIIPRDNKLFFHLIGTNYYEEVCNPTLSKAKEYWSMSLESETDTVYRAEYLAYQVLESAKREEQNLNLKSLAHGINEPESLVKLIRDYSTPLYKQGYQKGIHDHDAAQILQSLIPVLQDAGLLIYDPSSRALAQLFYMNLPLLEAEHSSLKTEWRQRATSALELRKLFADDKALSLLANDIGRKIEGFAEKINLDATKQSLERSASYLAEQLATTNRDNNAFVQSRYAAELMSSFERSLDSNALESFKQSIHNLKEQPRQQYALATAWLEALAHRKEMTSLKRYIPETAVNLIGGLNLFKNSVKLDQTVDQLLGEHPRLENQTLTISADEFMQRMHQHHNVTIPNYQAYLELRSHVMNEERVALKLNSFKARPLSSFVRNRLVNESYLPIIGDNLAKQMGTIGESKRTDLMGLLMMISPPGYGKTTLMEYVANRLGLIFMKINCPALGHDVTSLDPEQAPNSTAKQELEKINLAFEMGNNVMLYLDDIQHTHPEFLQKYISLCDGTRRIEGIWRNESKTYDMRGKKFCVVMAGNPYTESGEVFKVPDMLANRADIYNLGDILGGMEEQFSLSYIENALTSNPVLAPLATRDMQDVYHLIKMAQGETVASTDLSHQYSGAEINEIVTVLKKLFVIQKLIFKVNQQYIASAAQDDRYRTEPAFKLQGSYRNMNKMAEKVSGVMNQSELSQLIDDHYLGESQLLTKGTEENLLKLGELRGSLSKSEQTRWQKMKEDFSRSNALGGDDADSGLRIANQMMDIVQSLNQLNSALSEGQANERHAQDSANDREARWHLEQSQQMAQLARSISAIAKSFEHRSPPVVEVVNQPSPQMVDTLDTMANAMENSIKPLILSMEKKMDIDLRTLENITELGQRVDQVKESITKAATKKAKSRTQKP